MAYLYINNVISIYRDSMDGAAPNVTVSTAGSHQHTDASSPNFTHMDTLEGPMISPRISVNYSPMRVFPHFSQRSPVFPPHQSIFGPPLRFSPNNPLTRVYANNVLRSYMTPNPVTEHGYIVRVPITLRPNSDYEHGPTK